MAADLDHVIVRATDPRRSAALLAGVLGAPVLPATGSFVRVATGNSVTLDYLRDDPPFTEQHCAFLVDDTTFDTAHQRLVDGRVPIYADARRSQPGEINHHHGRRCLYFDDPDGHLMELITSSDGESPEE